MKRLMLCGVAAFTMLAGCGSDDATTPPEPVATPTPVAGSTFTCSGTVGEYRDGLGNVQAAVLNHPQCLGAALGG